MPDARPADPKDVERILAAQKVLADGQVELEKAVAAALKHGASLRQLSEATGIATNTLMKYGRTYGWPTKENRANFNATRYGRWNGPTDRS